MAHAVAIAALLGAATVILLLCSLGVAVASSPYDRVHLLGPAAMLASPLVVAAIVVEEGLSPLGIKAMLVALLLGISGPVLGHATARAALIRERGGLSLPERARR